MSDIFSSTQKQSNPAPWLRISAGSQFGYRAAFGFNSKQLLLFDVVQDVTLQAGLHLLVAPNGAGKTTLLRTLAGLHQVLKGEHEITGIVHYVSDQLQMDGEIQPRTLFKAWLRGDAYAYALLLSDKLKLSLRCPIQKLSRGNRQKVLLIVAESLAAYSGPSLLLLDEPLTGMDAETREIVAEIWASNATSLLRLVVLHELEAVKHANSLLTVANGKLLHTTERRGQSWMETCNILRARS